MTTITTVLTIIAACTGLAVASLFIARGRSRQGNGRRPINIDFDHAKSMENKYR